MDYLFYDIECSDGRHMCSFGYVITDEYFNILEKADILINPEAIFHTGAWSKKNREKDPGIELAYPKERFKANPTFPARYERIQRLLQHDDRKIIGFSHHNDALFLTVACKRYELPIIDYKFYDAQEMFGESRNIVNQVALNAIAEALEVDLSKLVQHRSDDDAEASMLVTKALCKDLGLTIEELIGHCPRCAGEVTAEGKCKYYVREAKRAEKRMRAAAVRSNRMTTKNLEEFKKYVRGLKPDPILELTFRGKKVTLNSPYEYKHFKETCLIAKEIAARGGKYVRMGSEADIYVADEQGKRCMRLPHVKRAIAAGKAVETITMGELLTRLSLTEKELENAEFPVVPEEGTPVVKKKRRRSRKKRKPSSAATANAPGAVNNDGK
ncbi:MAG: hypothetical protein IAB16_07130 [Firmicutes bacterium]|uniref:Exonuclease domain-containing protein n=1 Tax=Candidatus Stercoripulliclostridium pullicola TaxID=2840953 RepID=A0A940DIG0_9FIRM|nr:hypothetical protein [Candidatus Stercoripulliclostridium pullicola]